MEFKYRAVQDRRTPSPPPRHPLSTRTYVSDRPLRGYMFSSGGFPVADIVGEAFRRELEREHIQWEVEKEEIRRQILAREMARRRELEEEVRREIAMERALRIPLGISFRERVSVSFNQNQRKDDNNIFGGSLTLLPPQINKRQQCNKDKVVILAKPNADSYGAKRKAVEPLTIDDNEHSGFSLQKKPKQEWSCALCRITTTNEKGLNDHFQGKKHKTKEASLRTQKIGLDARLDSQTHQPGIIPTDTGIMEPRKDKQVVQNNSQGLDGLDNENETTTRKEASQTNALTRRKKFKFYCALCKVQSRSEIVMQTHKNGKKHLTNMKNATNFG